MEKINIICVDDQADVLDTVLRDLRPLQQCFRLEGASSAEDCRTLMNEIDHDGDFIGLVISDHVMPGDNGVALLGSISQDERYDGTRKMLLTGQATHADTIRAVNEAHIDNYLEKPWKVDELLRIAKNLLTHYIVDKGIDYTPYMALLDQSVLLEHLRKG